VRRDDQPAGRLRLLADDFTQYYLGAYSRVVRQNPTGFRGTGDPLSGAAAVLAGSGNPLNEAGDFDVTSDNLPVAELMKPAMARLLR
jgi:hypothetical protein